LLSAHESVCLLGSSEELNAWDTEKPLLLHKKNDWWILELNLSSGSFPFSYKYGVYHSKKETFIRFEEGDNRFLNDNASANKQTIIHDGFVRLPNNTWKGAGLAIPVFSLRTNNSFGIGEFADIKLLVDWAAETGLKIIQLLPINDTTATYSWKDSYPYAAISAFALHPIYINLPKVAGKKNSQIVKSLAKKQKQLNGLEAIDYEQVIHFKMNTLRELYELDDMQFVKEHAYKNFSKTTATGWFRMRLFVTSGQIRDLRFFQMENQFVYNEQELERLHSPKTKQFRQISFYYFVQYHLHLQFKEAADYAHKKGIAFKGDIPIGIYRYGCDAWTAPELYNMDLQAGAPPDDFTIKGQNWGFPTYNWKKMEEDHFEWWRQRFHQMSNYFDAFRIDHILGFFRIWSIPVDSVEGILGRFIPAFRLRHGIW
jgi:4-alpha-glucanotransferase